LLRTLPDEIPILGAPKTLEGRQKINRLKQVGLSLGVVTPKDTDPRRRIEIDRPKVTKVSKLEAGDLQSNVPRRKVGYSSRIGMIT
jgi:hypothetical protein